jgi:hypothetical protein
LGEEVDPMRRRFATFPVAVLALASWTSLAHAVDPVCGDLNDSGEITVADALVLLRNAIGEPVDLQCSAPGALTRTGQALCWSLGGNQINCNGTRQDGELRVGEPISFTDNGNGTITDNVTGLMWEKLSRNGTLHEVSDTFDWDSAFEKIAMLNDNGFAGHSDWRMPNQRELFSLVVFGGAADQTISAIFRDDCEPGCAVTTCSCTASDKYWSSTTNPFLPANAVGIDFGTASTFSATKGSFRHVRAVRTARD